MTNEERREAFEAAMGAAGYELNPPIYRDGTYRFAHYAAGWEMWQAATAAERERCAKVCDSMAKLGAEEGISGAVIVATELSTAIRKG